MSPDETVPDDREDSQRDDSASDAGEGNTSSDGDDSSSGESDQVAETGPLDIQQRHPNGTVLKVLGVSVGDTSTAVEVEALNGFTEDIDLNALGVHLVDDLGNSYNFVEPEQNADLEVARGLSSAGR